MSIEKKIESLGGLHDSMVMAVDWNAEARTLRIVVDDINANTRGLPEHPGPARATLVFSEVRLLHADADLASAGLRIFEWVISRSEPDGFCSSIALSPGGRLAIECRQIAIEPG